MAFILTLQEGQPLEVVRLTGNGEHIARTAVGYDDHTENTYSVVVALSPRPGYGDMSDFELVFSLVESNEDNDYIHQYWNGSDTKLLLPNAPDRSAVRDVIKMLIEALIDDVHPDVVSMVTHTPYLPPPALQKFHQIGLFFAENGYEVGQADPWNGQCIWMMRRNAPH